jgi:predicted flavoprotein YhiN
VQTSKPPQSVASVNITNLEDSEGLIRAYKKKKAELDDIKERFYQIETDYFTEKQKNVLLEEDVGKLRITLNKTERLLKEVQLKESRKDSDIIMKQLLLKQQEIEAYKAEV